MYWLAAAIFAALYLLIVSERVDKTKAALLAGVSMLGVGILSQEEAFYSERLGIDYNVIFLLIGMMILVGIMGKSGAFEFTAIWFAKLAGGSPKRILVVFVVFTAVASALLDNVTTVMLLAPVTLLIADELEIDPVPFLIAEALASNIGGTATLIGDPPNIMVASKARFTFLDFIVHLAPAVAVMLIALVLVVLVVFGNSLNVSEKHRARVMAMNPSKLIKDRTLVISSSIVLSITILGFALHSVVHIEPATIALVGAATLLFISKVDAHEILGEKIEWGTIFFFIGLFLTVGGIVKVGLVGDLSSFVVEATGPTKDDMFNTAIAMLWFSGIASAVVDNIPYVATMIPLVQDTANSVFHQGALDPSALPLATLHQPVLAPVWWCLALGACLGGNGSPIGASANVVVIATAQKAGHTISFLRFCKFGVPVMLMTLAIGTVYIWVRYYV
ncbi:MAG: ArsB/NhaD family transporter [Myxococcota bacterium]